MAALSGDRWRTATSYLDLVLDAPETDQDRFLVLLRAFDPEIASDVSLLIAQHRKLSGERFLEDGPQVPLTGPTAGARVGDYLLRSAIGYGGMGSVWLADRIDGRYLGKAAVKVLNRSLAGPAGEARFMREGTILAKLTHPHIGRLVDAGLSSAGQPYLVLEYIEGKDIEEFCRVNELSVEERIRLFLDVLDAVAHAHANLVVHRDLKPSNVLVTADGQVKLLDFGIAKLLENAEGNADVTIAREGAMTPRYAAPEQIHGEAVTTATDVYALGVLLYVLLSGQHPTGAGNLSAAELLRAIAETDPPPPSQAAPEKWRRQLSGDLDTIVMTALKKRPSERYQSGAAFADDLRRYLNHQPIAAHPDTLAYRAAKFTRRHRVPLAFASAAFVIVASLTVYYTARVASERDRAEREAAKASRISELLTGLLTGADPYRTPDAKEVTVRNLLDLGADRIDRELEGQPELKAEMLTVIGRVYSRLGIFDKALPLLDRALPLAREAFAGDHPRVAQALNDLGTLHRDRGDIVSARALLEEAVAMRRRLFGSWNPDLAITLVELARVYKDLGMTAESEAPTREALAIRRKAFGEEHRETSTSKNELALLLLERGELDEAESLFREGLATNTHLLGPAHSNTAMASNNLGLLLFAKGKPAEADPLFSQAVTLFEKNFGPEVPVVAYALNNHAYSALDLGRRDEARALLERAVAIARTRLGEGHHRYAMYETNLARIYLLDRKPAKAEPLLRHALGVREKLMRPGYWRIAQSKSLLGEALIALKRPGEAEALLLEAQRDLKSVPGIQGREAAANDARLSSLKKK